MSTSFCVLKHPHIPKKLKEVAGQSKIYIQPLQKDLIDLNDEDENVEVDSDVKPLLHKIFFMQLVL